MRFFSKIKQITFDAEGFAAAESGAVVENVKFVALSSLVLALVAAFETLGDKTNSLTGLPIAAARNAFGVHAAPLVMFLSVIAGSVFLLLAGGFAVHFCVRLLGGRKKFADTAAAMVAFLVPNLLFGWIPFVNIWTSIYTFLIIVYVLAIKQSLSMAKATTAIAIPIIVITLIAFFFGQGSGGMIQTLVPISGL